MKPASRADANTTRHTGTTALMVAAYNDHHDVISLLLEVLTTPLELSPRRFLGFPIPLATFGPPFCPNAYLE